MKAHLIVPLDSLAKAYGWDNRFGSSAALNPLRWSADGQHWGTGELWGIAQKAEVLGVFYNKATMKRLGIKVPTTFAEFEQSLATAKAGGRAADHGRQPRPLADGPRLHGAAVALRRPHRDRKLDVRPARRHLRRRRHPQGSLDPRAVGHQGLFRERLQRRQPDRRRRPLRQGRGALLHHRPLGEPDLRRPPQGRRRLLPAAVRGRQRRARPPRARCRSRTTSAPSPRTRRWPRRSSTGSPTRTRPAS